MAYLKTYTDISLLTVATSEFKSYVPLIWYIAKYFAPYQSTHSASCSSPSFYNAPASTAAAAALDVVIVVLVRFLVAVIVLCSALFFYSMSFALCCHYECLLFIDVGVGVCVCVFVYAPTATQKRMSANITFFFCVKKIFAPSFIPCCFFVLSQRRQGGVSMFESKHIGYQQEMYASMCKQPH